MMKSAVLTIRLSEAMICAWGEGQAAGLALREAMKSLPLAPPDRNWAIEKRERFEPTDRERGVQRTAAVYRVELRMVELPPALRHPLLVSAHRVGYSRHTIFIHARPRGSVLIQEGAGNV